jgi:hypothetical protein
MITVEALTWLIWAAVVISACTPILLIALIVKDWRDGALW